MRFHRIFLFDIGHSKKRIVLKKHFKNFIRRTNQPYPLGRSGEDEKSDKRFVQRNG